MSNIHFTDNNRDIIDYTINTKYASNKYSKKALKVFKDKIIEYLSPEERKLLYYIYIDSLSADQIADKLNLSRNYVYKKIRKLKNDIQKIGDALILYNLSVLTADERILYEQYFCYRNSIQSIAAMLNKDRHTVSKSIEIIKAKLHDNLSQNSKKNS